DREAVAAIGRNLEATRLGGAATIVRSEVMMFLGRRMPFDLALLDPSYAFDGWGDLFAGLDAELAVAESDRAVEPDGPWKMVRCRRYGTTVVTIVRRT